MQSLSASFQKAAIQANLQAARPAFGGEDARPRLRLEGDILKGGDIAKGNQKARRPSRPLRGPSMDGMAPADPDQT